MTRVLVCVKRIPDQAGEVVLSADGQSVDGRHTGYTIGDHDSCAVELGIRVADATGGSVTLVSVGGAEAADQLRAALALGAQHAVLVEVDPVRLGPRDVAHEIAAVMADHQAAGAGYDLVLLGNDAPDSGDFQVPIRLAYRLGWPVVTGASVLETTGGSLAAQATGPDGEETYTVALPAVVSVMEGGTEPRYPTLKGRMTAKKVQIEHRAAAGKPVGSGRLRMQLPPQERSTAQVLGEGPGAAGAVVDLLERMGVAR